MAKLAYPFILLCILVIAIPKVGAQQAPTKTSDPALARLAAARKVFISNLGEDIEAAFDAGWNDRVDQPYNYLYAAMQTWGQYQLVLVPADADLIFESRYSDNIVYISSNKAGEPPDPIYYPQLTLTIRDPATHAVVKEFTEKINWASLPSNLQKNFAQATVALLNDIAKMLGRPNVTFMLPTKIVPAPVPPQLLAAKTVFISRPAEDNVRVDAAKTQRLYEQVAAAIKTSRLFEIAATAQDADIIWEPSIYYGDLRMAIIDPKTQILLWGFYQPVRRTLFNTEPQKNLDQATVALLNQASQLAGKVAFGVYLMPNKILASALNVPVQVSISAPATAKPGSDVQVHVTLKNTTSVDLDFAYAEGDPLSCVVAVSDAGGKPLADTAQGTKLKAEHASWQGQRLKYSIHPGETQTRDCAVSTLFDISAPGKYAIQVHQLDGHVVQSNVVNVTIAR